MNLIKKYLIHPVKRTIAKYYLLLLQKIFGLTVIGITGSTGKTTTKEMVSSILSQKGKTAASYANIDPVYNIPTTILKCTPLTKYLVLEMGVEYKGEMDFYLWLAKPQVGVITNIYPTHTLYLDNIQGVFEEKSKLVKKLEKGDYAVLNKENSYLRNLSRKTKAKIIWFGESGDMQAEKIELTNQMKTKFTLVNGMEKKNVHLPMVGYSIVSNALAAASVGKLFNLNMEQIKNGLENFKPQDHRMKINKLSNGTIIIDDSYNNNPAAAKEALKNLKILAGSRKMIVVFGDMLELGNLEEKYHQEIGRLIGSMNINYLVAVGKASQILAKEAETDLGEEKVKWVDSAKKVVSVIRPLLKKDVVVLIKGSRSIGLDKVASALYT